MDLSTLDTKRFAEEGAFMHLKHPTTGMLFHTNDMLEKPIIDDEGEIVKGDPVGIKLRGKDSATHRSSLKSLMRISKAKGKKKDKEEGVIDLDSMEVEGAEIAAYLTIDFINIVDDEESVKFSHEAAVALYVKYPWIAEQVRSFTADRANFIKS